MINVVDEAIEMCRGYIDSLIQTLDVIHDYFQNGEEKKGMSLTHQVVEGFEFLINSVEQIKKYGALQHVEVTKITHDISRVKGSIESNNYALVVDLLTHHMRPVLKTWSDDMECDSVVGLVFSKDRAMQLDATLRSLYLHCTDIEKIDLKVLYVTSSQDHEAQYHQLMHDYKNVEFIKEDNFKQQLFSTIESYKYVFFAVDDNIFVAPFSMKQIIDFLHSNDDALGFSLRLGRNTHYCYPVDREQNIPSFIEQSDNILKFNWTQSELDFGYPLELSSSVYLVRDILSTINQEEFANPNTLESVMHNNRSKCIPEKSYLLCNKRSITFCNPVNVTQNVVNNRAGQNPNYSTHELFLLFNQGYRVDVTKYSGFIPNGCHQEVKMVFSQFKGDDTSGVQHERIRDNTLPDNQTNLLEFLRNRGLINSVDPVRLHLGCGEQKFDGYINIDYPPSEHNVMNVVADVFADITKIKFPENSIDEIRLHHVFEHFNRVTALALLIRWHAGLKIGGKLVIETPDLVGGAKTLLSDTSFKVKMGVVRHLAGDQAADWAYHVDHWFPERFTMTLQSLGFSIVSTQSMSWPMEPYLSNVLVIAQKEHHVPVKKQLETAEELLWHSTVSPSEKETHRIWVEQLRAMVINNEIRNVSLINTPRLSHEERTLPLVRIHEFNQLSRDEWVREKAATVAKGSKVLDVGAGTCPYRSLFSHCEYYSHDFKKYQGVKLGGTSDYGEIDIVSSIENIPVEDSSFDVVLCTEVLEHVPEPLLAIQEMSRILKPNGRILITAPLGSGLHQLPYHYYGGYTPEWYKYAFEKFNINVIEITPNGGFFKHLAQECARAAGIIYRNESLRDHNDHETIRLLYETLPRFLYNLDDKLFMEEFTVGYHVEGVKTN